jgi:DNA-binding winged helix-turn-helix (wHTH) protein
VQTPLAEPDEEQKQAPGHHPPLIAERRSMPPAPGAVLEFRRFRILLRRRELLADGVPVKLGTRAFDLLMVLVEAEGSLVTKAELLGRAWPGIVVIEDNLKVQISKLREAFAGDGDLIRTEFGRGYRFTGEARRLTIDVAEAWPAPAATWTAFATEPAEPADLAAIASRLTSLETKLAEAMHRLNAAPRHGAFESRRHSRRAELAGGGKRSHRRAKPLFAIRQKPGKTADRVAGG